MAILAKEHCVNKACGKGFPRAVNFCPYCGTDQQSGAVLPESPSDAAAVAVAPAAATSAAAQQIEKTASPAVSSSASASAQPSGPPPGQPRVQQSSRPGNAGIKPPPIGRAGGPPLQAPLRKPVSKSTWALVVLGLAAIWIIAKPDDPRKKLEARVDHAVELTTECKLDVARAELAALKTDKATPAQLKRLQAAISGTAPACEKRRLRVKAWSDLRPALESALKGGEFDRAASRLAGFAKKWGEDADTRDWDNRIDLKRGERLLDEADACLQRKERVCLENKLIAAERLQRVELSSRIQLLREDLSRLLEATMLEQSAPSAIGTAPQVVQNEPQARKALADAEREMAQGNYRGAMEKAEICATMIDVGNRPCLALKQRAERLQREMLRCVASGAEWISDRCH